MFSRYFVFVSYIFVFLISSPVWSALPDVPPGLLNEANNSYIFVFTDDVAARDVPGLAKGLAKKANGNVRNIFKASIKGFSANMSASAAVNLAAKNPNIAYFEQNGIASIPAIANKGKGPNNPPAESPSQFTPWGVTRVGGPKDGTGKVAWIIDSGVDINNADLNIDAERGQNFVNNAKKPNDIKDKNGHGTHVAGILAAIDNSIGVVGVAENATIVPLRVFGASGQGFVDDIVEAVDYAAAKAAAGDVVNMSLTTFGLFDSLHDAVIAAADKGIKFAVCAGNGSDFAGNYDPSRVEHKNVFTVSSTDKKDNFASFSSYGNPPIDFAAPGVDVESYVLNNEIVSWNGCSMATPHVAGILLLGKPKKDGTAGNDPDFNPDPIAHF